MPKRAKKKPDLEDWAAALDASADEIKTAWDDLQRRGLASVRRGKILLSPLAMRRANSDMQRRLTAHLAGYVLTENSFIVLQAGEQAGFAQILDTRMTVEYIASYFKQGWGVTDIERDLSVLTREEIEAAIQYYLNHREEIEQQIERSREIYEFRTRKQEMVSA